MRFTSILERELTALIAIRDYLTAEERVDFEESNRKEKRRHIYRHVGRLSAVITRAQIGHKRTERRAEQRQKL